MSYEDLKRPVRLFVDGYTQRDSTLLQEALAPDLAKFWIEKQIPQNSTYWADDRLEIIDMIAEGDKVWAHVTHSTRHIGEYKGLPPTGKTQSHSLVLMCRVAEGKIVQHQVVSDRLSEVEQLGAKIVPGAQ
jgi:ketosteroid isomerase-like protein